MRKIVKLMRRRTFLPVVGMRLTEDVVRREQEGFLDTEGLLESLDMEVRDMLGMN